MCRALGLIPSNTKVNQQIQVRLVVDPTTQEVEAETSVQDHFQQHSQGEAARQDYMRSYLKNQN